MSQHPWGMNYDRFLKQIMLPRSHGNCLMHHGIRQAQKVFATLDEHEYISKVYIFFSRMKSGK